MRLRNDEPRERRKAEANESAGSTVTVEASIVRCPNSLLINCDTGKRDSVKDDLAGYVISIRISDVESAARYRRGGRRIVEAIDSAGS